MDAFTATEVSQLFDIANQCPLMGGRGRSYPCTYPRRTRGLMPVSAS